MTTTLAKRLPSALPADTFPAMTIRTARDEAVPRLSRGIVVLATCAAAAHLLDLVTFLQVMALQGPSVEVNPFARTLFAIAGPAGVAAVKLFIAIGVPLLLATRARVAARVPLVRVALVLAVALGVVGFTSNLLTAYL